MINVLIINTNQIIRVFVIAIPMPIKSHIKRLLPYSFGTLFPKLRKAMDIFALFHPFCQVHLVSLLRNLSVIIAGALCAPHTITMRNIARWSTYGYR